MGQLPLRCNPSGRKRRSPRTLRAAQPVRALKPMRAGEPFQEHEVLQGCSSPCFSKPLLSSLLPHQKQARRAGGTRVTMAARTAGRPRRKTRFQGR